jgi:hypothetical protein
MKVFRFVPLCSAFHVAGLVAIRASWMIPNKKEDGYPMNAW